MAAARHPEHRQRLHRPLVDPARRNLRRTGDPYLDAGGVGEIHDMRLHAVLETPTGLATGAGVEVAQLRADDAAIAAGKAREARVAVALIEALSCFPTAGDAVNAPGESQAQPFAQQWVERHRLLPHRQLVGHDRLGRHPGPYPQLSEVSGENGHAPLESIPDCDQSPRR